MVLLSCTLRIRRRSSICRRYHVVILCDAFGVWFDHEHDQWLRVCRWSRGPLAVQQCQKCQTCTFCRWLLVGSLGANKRCQEKNETSHIFAKCLKVSKLKHGSPKVSRTHAVIAADIKDVKRCKLTKGLMVSQKTLKKFLKVPKTFFVDTKWECVDFFFFETKRVERWHMRHKGIQNNTHV